MPTPLRRQPGQWHAVVAHFETLRNLPHVWGTRDCWTVVRDAVRLMTRQPTFGADLAAYEDARGAIGVLNSVDVYTYFRNWGICGLAKATLAQAGSGDILVWSGDDGPLTHFGFVIGRDVWDFSVEGQVNGRPLRHCIGASAWETGLRIYRVAVA